MKKIHDYINEFLFYMKRNKYSKATIESYEKVLNQFDSFLIGLYKGEKEPININPSDIKNYLKSKIDTRNVSISTANKELTILKTFFNYLWENDIVKIDPCVKIKPFKVQKSSIVEITYDEIINILVRVLNNTRYSEKRKTIYLLATKGFRTSDFHFKKDDVTINELDETVTIHLKNRTIELDRQESSYFISYFQNSLFETSDYVFTSKQDGIPGPIQVMSILNHLRVIASDYLPEKEQPLTLVTIRRAITYYLYYNKKKPIQYIATYLGIEEKSVTQYLKTLDRVSLNEIET